MSGIYIPGMEMPKEDEISKCFLIRHDGEVWVVEFDNLISDLGYVACYPTNPAKAIPVPDHGRQDGLYSKYFVIKTETGEIVQDCFVLRPQKDKAAVAALLLYAEETESQELSSDIRGWISTIIPASKEGEG